MGLAGDASRSLAGLINPSPGIALAATTRRYYLYIHEICLHPTDHPVAENTRHGAFLFSGLPQQQGISLNRKESKGHINPVIEKNEAQGFIAWGRAIEKLAPSSSNKETL